MYTESGVLAGTTPRPSLSELQEGLRGREPQVVLAGTTPRPSLSDWEKGTAPLSAVGFGGDYSPPFVERYRVHRHI